MLFGTSAIKGRLGLDSCLRGWSSAVALVPERTLAPQAGVAIPVLTEHFLCGRLSGKELGEQNRRGLCPRGLSSLRVEMGLKSNP